MGLFGGKGEPAAEQDLDDESRLAGVANALVGKLMDLGLDGVGPLDSVQEVVRQHQDAHGDPEGAIDALVRAHVRLGAGGGFVTGFGGLLTMGVSLPANIVGFYVLATRMVGGIATIRGYDVTRPEARSAVLLSLVGADSQEVLRKAGVTGGGRLAQVALQRLPRAAVMVINKAVGFRLASRLTTKTLSRFGRAVPVLGGVLGAGLDGYLMHKIAGHARSEFPQRSPGLPPV